MAQTRTRRIGIAQSREKGRGVAVSRSFKRALWRNRLTFRRATRQALPPTLMGLVCFSFVLVGFGAAVYLAAVPSLVAQSAGVQAAGQAIEESGVVEALQEAAEGSAQAVTGLFNPSSTGSGAATTSGISFSGVNAASPTSSQGADGEASSASSEEPAAAGDGGSSTGSGTDSGSSAGTPSAPAAGDDTADDGTSEYTGPSETEEAAYHAGLVEAYNALPSYADSVNGVIATYNSTALTGTSDERYLAFQDCDRVFNGIHSAGNAVSALQVPPSSKWHASAVEIKALYDDLYSATAKFRLAWVNNIFIEDQETLVAYQSQWAAPVLDSLGADGQITYLADYAARYPQVAL